MQEPGIAPPPSPHRRPPALLPAATARLAGFAALALLGAVQWQRMVDTLSWGHALLWVLVAVLAAVGILWADALSRFRGTATLLVALASLVAAYATSGLELALLKPRRIDELAAGLSHGAEALANVQMPYAGADPWPAVTLQLLGAFLCVLAGLLAFWPRAPRASSAGAGDSGRGYQFLSLALLLVLVASPVVSMGGTQPVLLGVALTALTVCFLWLERLPLRPGLGIAGMLALALAGALPLASAAEQGGAVVRLQGVRRGARARTTRCSSAGGTATGRSRGRATAPRCCASRPSAAVVLEGRRPRRLRRRDVDRQRARHPRRGRPRGRSRERLGGAAGVARRRCA